MHKGLISRAETSLCNLVAPALTGNNLIAICITNAVDLNSPNWLNFFFLASIPFLIKGVELRENVS